MAGRHVERVEEVVGVLDLVAVDDLVAETEEDVLDLAPDLREQVVVAARRCVAGKRDVERLLAEQPLEGRCAQGLLARVERRLERFAESVQRHPRLAIAHLAKGLLELALAAEVADARLLELVGAAGCSDRALRLGFESLRIHARDDIA